MKDKQSLFVAGVVTFLFLAGVLIGTGIAITKDYSSSGDIEPCVACKEVEQQ